MTTTLTSDLILPEVLAPEIMKGFAGRLFMASSGALTVVPGLIAGRNEVGNAISVPIIEDSGEAEEVAQGAAGTPTKITMSSETGTVVRLYKGISMATLARNAKMYGRDIYDVAQEQIALAFARKMERIAIARGLARAASSSMVYDGSGVNFSTTHVIETLKKFGEELDDNLLACWAMNPTPYWTAATLEDSTGRTLYTDVQGGKLTNLGGAPVKMTSQTEMVSGSVYSSPLFKKGAVVAWTNEMPRIDVVRDADADVDMLKANLYCVVHCYSIQPGGTKPGVAVAKSL